LTPAASCCLIHMSSRERRVHFLVRCQTWLSQVFVKIIICCWPGDAFVCVGEAPLRGGGATGACEIAATPDSASSASAHKERNNDMSLTYSEWKNPGIPMSQPLAWMPSVQPSVARRSQRSPLITIGVCVQRRRSATWRRLSHHLPPHGTTSRLYQLLLFINSTVLEDHGEMLWFPRLGPKM